MSCGIEALESGFEAHEHDVVFKLATSLHRAPRRMQERNEETKMASILRWLESGYMSLLSAETTLCKGYGSTRAYYLYTPSPVPLPLPILAPA